MSGPYPLPLPDNENLNLEAQSASVGDTNGDGRIDVAFFADGWGSSDPSVDHVAYIYEQQPDGTMAEAAHFTLAPGGVFKYEARGGALAELGGDAKAEIVLVAANGGKPDHLVILTRASDGSYVEAARIPSPLPPMQILTADLNQDGFTDIIVQSSEGTGFSIHWGRGNFAFSAPMLVQGYSGRDLLLGDADRDGVIDVLASALHADAGVEQGESAIGINYGLRNRSDGRLYDFTVPSIVDVPATGGTTALGTFGGQPSLAVWYETMEGPDANHTVWFHQNIALLSLNGRDSYPLRAQYRYQTGISRALPLIKAADIDADGDDDLIVFVSGSLEILLQTAGGFEPLYRVPNQPVHTGNVPPFVTSANIADFNGDGCLDLGHLRWSYVINYRLDCPTTATTGKPHVQLQPPTRPTKVQRMKPAQSQRQQRR
ncbi:FG-GAP repeat domain-containing protein [Lysobacter tyrosinilyticus]